MAVYPATLSVGWTRIFCPSDEHISDVNVSYEAREKLSSSEIFMQEGVHVEHLIN